MSKEEIISFDGRPGKIMIGLSWDALQDPGQMVVPEINHDLDLSCALLSEKNAIIDIVHSTDPKQNKYKFQILHTGDQKNGASSLSDEEIHINLENLDPDIYKIVFMVSSKNALKLKDVKNIKCIVYNEVTHEKIFTSTVNNLEKDEGDGYYVVGAVGRKGFTWFYKTIETFVSDSGAGFAKQLQSLLNEGDKA